MPRNFERVLTRNIIFSHQFIHLDSTKINSYSFNKLSSIRIKKILLSPGIIHYFYSFSSFLASLSFDLLFKSITQSITKTQNPLLHSSYIPITDVVSYNNDYKLKMNPNFSRSLFLNRDKRR